MESRSCPCGLGDDYDVCCGRLHSGAPAPTAEALMRARFTAFALRDTEYLKRTWHPSTRPADLAPDPSITWTRLAVLETTGGGIFDTAGTVRFRALFTHNGKRGSMDENSRFTREDGTWLYLGQVE